MTLHVILLTDAIEAPSDVLLAALEDAGIVPFIEVLREIQGPENASAKSRESATERNDLVPQPLAVLYEVIAGADLLEIYSAVEHSIALWPGVPLVACRTESDTPFRQTLRVIEASTLRRLGFHAVADDPAQIPALLRKIEDRGQTGELNLPAALTNPFLVSSVPLPERLSARKIRNAFQLIAALHHANDQRTASQTAIEGLSQLVKADGWTIYLNGEGSIPSTVNLEPLAVKIGQNTQLGNFEDDWRRVLLSNALIATGPISSGATEAVSKATTVRQRLNGQISIAIPLISSDRVVGVIEAVRSMQDARRFTASEQMLLESISSPIASALANSLRIAEAEKLSQTDDLTKLHNARYLRHFLLTEVKRARRYGSSVSAVFLDLDNFKRINDVHGHLAGSHVLMEMATIILSSVRDTDVVARYGGDEFVIVLPETGVDHATFVANRIREKISVNSFNGGRQLDLSLTASFGVASFPLHAQSPQQLVAFADTAMYEAKAEGKNRVNTSGALSSICNEI